jgi:hypothetical protein
MEMRSCLRHVFPYARVRFFGCAPGNCRAADAGFPHGLFQRAGPSYTLYPRRRLPMGGQALPVPPAGRHAIPPPARPVGRHALPVPIRRARRAPCGAFDACGVAIDGSTPYRRFREDTGSSGTVRRLWRVRRGHRRFDPVPTIPWEHGLVGRRATPLARATAAIFLLVDDDPTPGAHAL